MDLAVSYNKAQNKDEAFDLAKEQITPEYVDKFKIKAEISYNKDAGLMKASGKGFDLELLFTDSECQISIKLSLLYRALKNKVLDTVKSKLERHV